MGTPFMMDVGLRIAVPTSDLTLYLLPKNRFTNQVNHDWTDNPI